MSDKPRKEVDRHLGKPITFHIPIEWVAALNIVAAKEGLNRAQLMRKIVRFYVEKKKHEHPKDNFGIDGN
jgi:metal-responsive CopG/Arc/MetJ family transcriptional regulator